MGYSRNVSAILKDAEARARDSGHGKVGTEDLLHAMFHGEHTASKSKAVQQLYDRGITKEIVWGSAQLSENAKLALSAAVAKAHELGHSRVGTEDLLWALFKKTKEDSRAHFWLVNVGVPLAALGAPAQVQEERRSESVARQLVVGGLAGSFECVVTQPTMVWKTMAQTGTRMSWQPSVLYRGTAINASSIGFISAVQYAADGSLCRMHEAMTGQHAPSTRGRLGISALAGALSAGLVTPIERIMILQHKTGRPLGWVVSGLWQKGAAAMFRGIMPTTLREAGWVLGFLGVTPVVKRFLREDSKTFRRSEVLSSVVSAMVGGVAAAVITQPADVVKTVMQAGDKAGTASVVAKIYRKGGLGTFWRGLVPRTLRLTVAVLILGETQEVLSSAFDAHNILEL